LQIITRPYCELGVETPRQFPSLMAHVVYLADEFRVLLEYEIGHGWPSYVSDKESESSGVLKSAICQSGNTQRSVWRTVGRFIRDGADLARGARTGCGVLEKTGLLRGARAHD